MPTFTQRRKNRAVTVIQDDSEDSSHDNQYRTAPFIKIGNVARRIPQGARKSNAVKPSEQIMDMLSTMSSQEQSELLVTMNRLRFDSAGPRQDPLHPGAQGGDAGATTVEGPPFLATDDQTQEETPGNASGSNTMNVDSNQPPAKSFADAAVEVLESYKDNILKLRDQVRRVVAASDAEFEGDGEGDGDVDTDKPSAQLLGSGRPPELNHIQDLVRQYASKLLGVTETRGTGKIIRTPLPHSPLSTEGVSPNANGPFRPVWLFPITYQWNAECVFIFTDSFLKEPAHKSIHKLVPKPYKVVAEAFSSHYETLRKRYRAENVPRPGVTTAGLGRAQKNAKGRKETVYRQRSIAAVRYAAEIDQDFSERAAGHLKTLGINGMSTDEEIQTETGTVYRILEKTWRSAEATLVLRQLDRLYAYKRDPRGSPLRRRVEDHASQSHRMPVPHLAPDYYSSEYLEGLRREGLEFELANVGVGAGEADLSLPLWLRTLGANGGETPDS